METDLPTAACVRRRRRRRRGQVSQRLEHHKELRVLKKILDAFQRFDNGDRPPAHRNPKRWFVQHNSQLYPLKHIYHLATELPPEEFHTNAAKNELTKLGFSVVISRP
jgi:hypothetical protein